MSRWEVSSSLSVTVLSELTFGRGNEEEEGGEGEGWVNFRGTSAMDVQFWVSRKEDTSVGKFWG
jgi:hypothetical protein